MIMTTEADTSGSGVRISSNSENQQSNITHSFHHQHLRLQQPMFYHHTGVTSSNFHSHNHMSDEQGDDDDNDDMNKLISVDEFDDSDNEDIRSCSTSSPTHSDNGINNSFSSRPYRSNDNTSSINSGHKSRKKNVIVSKALDDQELQSLRLKINSRERKRMHDLNSALDGLREVMPYAHGPSVRKLSKIATLLLAKNYILMLNSSLEEMKKLVSDIYQGSSRPTSHQMATSSLIPQTATCNVASIKTASDNSAANLRSNTMTPTVNISEAPTSFSNTPTTIPLTPLPAHHPATSMIPLPVASIRAPIPGLTPRDISTLNSIYPIPKSDINNIHGLSHVFPGHEHVQLLHRWPAPCACAQCLSGVGHVPLGLHLSRLSHPLLTSSAFLHRKN